MNPFKNLYYENSTHSIKPKIKLSNSSTICAGLPVTLYETMVSLQ